MLLALFGLLLGGPAIAKDSAVARGEQVYHQLCWTCHGKYGRGNGPMVANLKVHPPDFTDPKILRGKSDAQILGLIMPSGKVARSHTPMIIAQVVREKTLRDVLAYMRTLSTPGKHVSVYAGRDIFNNFCWVCHGKNGKGDGPAAQYLHGVKPRDFTSPKFHIKGREAQVYQVISQGAAKAIHGSDYMLEWGTRMSPQQIRDVMAYIETFKTRNHQR